MSGALATLEKPVFLRMVRSAFPFTACGTDGIRGEFWSNDGNAETIWGKKLAAGN
jgi:hypothetical protein